MKIDLTKYCGACHTRNTHLLALEIEKIYREKKFVLLTQMINGWDIVENGIETIVKEIADTLSIPYEHIVFESADRLTKSNVFLHIYNQHILLPKTLQSCEYKPPNQLGTGLFLGRATNERLYAFWKSCNLTNSLRTCHLQVQNIEEHNSDFSEFICEHNDQWQSIKNLFPYTDIADIDQEFSYNDTEFATGRLSVYEKIYRFDTDTIWQKVYNKIDIEIVCETNTTADTFFITEKTFRPLHYGRLFLVIGSPSFEKNLKNLGFDIFDDILDKSYDNLESYMRVDAVFNSLQKYINDPVDYNILKQRLINNQKLLVKVAHERLL